jgi:hypothetical protein
VLQLLGPREQPVLLNGHIRNKKGIPLQSYRQLVIFRRLFEYDHQRSNS